jgi:hypothetical protein
MRTRTGARSGPSSATPTRRSPRTRHCPIASPSRRSTEIPNADLLDRGGQETAAPCPPERSSCRYAASGNAAWHISNTRLPAGVGRSAARLRFGPDDGDAHRTRRDLRPSGLKTPATDPARDPENSEGRQGPSNKAKRLVTALQLRKRAGPTPEGCKHPSVLFLASSCAHDSSVLHESVTFRRFRRHMEGWKRHADPGGSAPDDPPDATADRPLLKSTPEKTHRRPAGADPDGVPSAGWSTPPPASAAAH